jgi:hypothetical protein
LVALLTLLARINRVFLPLVVRERFVLVTGCSSITVRDGCIKALNVVADAPVLSFMFETTLIAETDECRANRSSLDILPAVNGGDSRLGH